MSRVRPQPISKPPPISFFDSPTALKGTTGEKVDWYLRMIFSKVMVISMAIYSLPLAISGNGKLVTVT